MTREARPDIQTLIRAFQKYRVRAGIEEHGKAVSGCHDDVLAVEAVMRDCSVGALRELSKMGFDFDRVGPNGTTLAHAVAEIGCPGKIGVLAAASVPFDQVDGFGIGTMHMATRSYRADGVAAVMAAGGDPRSPDILGRTPLHWALAANFGMVRAVLSAGSPVDATCARGRTPLCEYLALDRAVDTDVERFIRTGVLKKTGARDFEESGEKNMVRIAVVDALLSRGASVDKGDNDGRKPAHYLTSRFSHLPRDDMSSFRFVNSEEFTTIASMLQARGADFKEVDNRGMNPVAFLRMRDQISALHAKRELDRLAGINPDERIIVDLLRRSQRVGSLIERFRGRFGTRTERLQKKHDERE